MAVLPFLKRENREKSIFFTIGHCGPNHDLGVWSNHDSGNIKLKVMDTILIELYIESGTDMG